MSGAAAVESELPGAEVKEGLVARLFSLSPERRLALAQLLARQGVDLDELAVLPAAPPAGGAPLSFAQERLWFLDRLEPGNTAYNIPMAFLWQGPLDAPRFAHAIDEVVRRHEVLRTRFVAGSESRDRLVQVVDPARPQRWTAVDLGGIPGPRRGGETARIARDEARLPFDLDRGPLLRLRRLLGAEGGDTAVLVTVHHAIADGWSLEILLGEVSSHYRALAGGAPAPLPELTLQYSDYAIWQRRRFTAARIAVEVEHWRQRLAGLPARIDLPLDRVRGARPSAQGRTVEARLSGEVATGLSQIARRVGGTSFMTHLAVFATLLVRSGAQSDLAIGTPIAGRVRRELEGLIGLFVNTLVLRLDLSAPIRFVDLVAEAREVVLDAEAHQELPFEKLVEVLAPERHLGSTPLFQVLFAVTPRAGGSGSAEALPLRALSSEDEAAKVDLKLSVQEGAAEASLAMVVRRDLFDVATAIRLVERYRRLAAAAAAAPETSIASLALLSAVEMHQLVHEENDTAWGAEAATLLDRFDLMVAAFPAAVAVEDRAERLTFSALDARSMALARRLAELGVGPDRAVALFIERSVAAIVAQMGILRAGGAYLPLDPGQPTERIARFLVLADDPWVLTRAPERLSLPPEARALDLDEAIAAGSESAAVPLRSAPENLAYVLFTSGSTGTPKGVCIEHRQAVHYLDAILKRLDLEPGAVYGVVSTLAADLGNTSIFPALFAHGWLRLASPEASGDAGVLAAELGRDGGVDLLKIVPSHLSALLHGVAAERLLPRRWLVLGGEASSWDLLEQVRRRAPGCRVLNHYGPTETTVGALTHEASEDPPRGVQVPLGRPLAGVSAFVVERWGGLAAVGVPGELLLGGAGLARGYFGRPDLTAERFLPDGRSGASGARLYRTGDLVRRHPDGVLDFLGRIDLQVKIRGFRIELGEVEAALRAYPGVLDAAVVVRGEGAARRLVAYVSAAGTLDRAAVLGALRRELPEPMVPSGVVSLPALPVTPNGKLDRAALPDPSEDAGDAGREARSPRTPTEEVLAGIWQEVLERDGIGIDDDFFGLGGHSLLATRLMARVTYAVGVDLPLRTLFEAPTIASLAGGVDAARGLGREAPPPIVRADRDRDLPLSFAQQRLWFLDRLEPGSSAYHIPFALRLSGPVRGDALAAAFSAIVRRHEVLRTRFPSRAEGPVQEIHPPGDVPLARIDLEALAVAAAEREILRLAAAEARRSFDLAAGPLLRVALATSSEQEHVLLATLHHIASDGWSTTILARQLAHFYRAAVAGEPGALPELPIQYADYAAWQRSWLAGDRLEGEIAYWRRQLGGAPPRIELPLDRPSGSIPGRPGAEIAIDFAPGLGGGLRRLARRFGATPFMVSLAAWAVLLARWSGQDDLCVGTPIAGRGRLEVENLIGFFVNTLVLRGPVVFERSFGDLVELWREIVLDAHAHQDLPFERLVEALQPERNLQHSPLFQVFFLLQSTPAPNADLGPVAVRRISGSGAEPKFDLTLALAESGTGLTGGFEYRHDRFDSATVGRMAAHLASLLAAAVEQPEVPLMALPWLGDAERAQLLGELAEGGAMEEGQRVGLHGLVAAQVRRAPEAIALEASGVRWSYARLAREAAGVARLLVGLGAGPEVRVGICRPRDARLVAGLLGILEAGAAYVPLDPALPTERLRAIVEDSGASFVLTDPDLAGRFEGLAARVVIAGPDLEAEPQIAVVPVEPNRLAYAIFTSGSTGRPKGVAIGHGSACALVAWAHRQFVPAVWNGVLAATSIGFDLSIFELFAPLAAGGRVVLVENALALADLGDEAGVVLVNTVPSAMAELIEAGAIPKTVTTVCLAGEPLPGRLVDRLYAAGVDSVYNLYGPTEDTTYSTFCRVEPGAGEPPIGRPLPGGRAYVVDRKGSPVPIGVAGELLLGGVGLARGYLGRPDLTAERFVPDGLSGLAGERLYRTGDLARWRIEGDLEYLGRIDHQVKVRGYRIELGEVEAALRDLPGVREAVVVARGEGAGRRLIAYLVGAVAMDAESRVAALRRRLPEYMLPAETVWLPALPLTPNGKIDRRALPEPSAAGSTGAALDAEPETELEKLVASIWAEVLGRNRIGANEDFFHAGGHSLLAVRVISRVRLACGIDLALRSLFEAPTLRGFARTIESARTSNRIAPPPIRPAPRTGPAPMSFAQQRLWFLDQLGTGSGRYHISRTIRIKEPVVASRLAEALYALVARHEVLRTLLSAPEGNPIQTVLEPSPVALPQVDLAALPAERRSADRSRLVGAAARRPFDLSSDRPIRALLVRSAAEDWLLALTLHHVACDGWSLEILRRDFAALYSGAASGRAPDLPSPPIRYVDFALWQREWLVGEVLAESVRYWRDRLTDLPEALPLPVDRPRGEVRSPRGGFHPIALPKSAVESLRAAGRRFAATPFMVALAAFSAWLSRATGERDLPIGTPVAGRNRPEVEDVVGLFVNTLVLRAQVEGDERLSSLLGRLREVVLEAHDQQELPFEKLVEELAPERDLGISPLFQVFFAYQVNAGSSNRSVARPQAPVSAEEGEAKFDLSLALVESDEGLTGGIEYAADLFDATTIDRLAARFERLFEAALADPGVSIALLPWPPEEERRQTLFNREAKPRRPDRGAEAARAAVGPPDRLARKLEEIWCDLLGRDRIGREDSFFRLGGHSLLALRLVAKIRVELGISLPLATLFLHPTLAGLAAALREPIRSPPSENPIQLRRGDSREPPSFWVHPVGGGVFCYADLAADLPGASPVFALQAAAADGPDSIEGLAARYQQDVERICPAGPLRLGGWSMGGLIAFEMARRIAESGRFVSLVVIDSPAPGRVEARPEDGGGIAYDFAADVLASIDGGARFRLPIARAELVSLTPEEALAKLLARLRDIGSFDLAPSDEEARLRLAIYRRLAAARHSYAGGRLAGDLLLLRAAEGRRDDPHPAWGWDALAATVHVETIPGDHYSCLKKPQVATVARRVASYFAGSRRV